MGLHHEVLLLAPHKGADSGGTRDLARDGIVKLIRSVRVACKEYEVLVGIGVSVWIVFIVAMI